MQPCILKFNLHLIQLNAWVYIFALLAWGWLAAGSLLGVARVWVIVDAFDLIESRGKCQAMKTIERHRGDSVCECVCVWVQGLGNSAEVL